MPNGITYMQPPEYIFGQGLPQVTGQARMPGSLMPESVTRFPDLIGEQVMPSAPQSNWFQNMNLGKLAGIGGFGLGALSAVQQYKNLNIDFNPSLTAKSAKDLIKTKGQKIGRQISREAVQTVGDVASQYEARGLGSSGSVIGDIAGVKQVAAGQRADVAADLNQQLLNALQYIDARDLAIAQQESAAKQGFWGDLADLALTGGGYLLAGPAGGYAGSQIGRMI